MYYSLLTVPTPAVTISPSGPIQGAMVGSPQVINCTVSTVSGVERNSVIITWMIAEGGSVGGSGGNFGVIDIIMSNDRVTIIPVTSIGGYNYTSSLQFTYLMEGDEGIYICDVMILETSETNLVDIENITSECVVYICSI